MQFVIMVGRDRGRRLGVYLLGRTLTVSLQYTFLISFIWMIRVAHCTIENGLLVLLSAVSSAGTVIRDIEESHKG
jgi:hypothetical protein